MSEIYVIQVAQLLHAVDMVLVGDIQTALSALERARRLRVAAARMPAHEGDCTKQPFTCLKCVQESYEKAARLLIDQDEDLVTILGGDNG